MTTIPCPYCATAVTGDSIAVCRGCGNPVPLDASRRDLWQFIKQNASEHFQTPKKINSARMPRHIVLHRP